MSSFVVGALVLRAIWVIEDFAFVHAELPAKKNNHLLILIHSNSLT
jgi:hypothetical protein